MAVKENLALLGNTYRIVEMDNAGMGAGAIAGTFQDNGIDLNKEDVIDTLRVIGKLRSKALPRKVAKQAIKNHHTFNGKPA
ncbi:hypothetical protein NRH57_001101 [Providencia rettgeri]|uniref:hypothetical protein n=1 Tax=Providencia rettgeri TaxID=587 RepID=UPI001B368E53|nr:hypothetical protein [Providencia rettgeri]ELR5238328.1 hypothetical protein [Providencia rettgeri]ELR5261199.1 hypothetical protein [Providencia rettgeri]MBQ0686853.1 hypothetical protein [Providencia rettgeri]MDK3008157.1 hypothetical protein [Providencia rettgeri]